MFDLTGKKALVTGATGGIGGAIARALHAQGATVALSGTRREALDELAGELGDRVHVVEANLSRQGFGRGARSGRRGRDGGPRHSGEQCRRHPGQPLHADEGRGVGHGASRSTSTAAFRLSRAAVKGMMRRRYGRIVNHRLDRRARPAIPGRANYAASRQACRHDARRSPPRSRAATSPSIAWRPDLSSHP